MSGSPEATNLLLMGLVVTQTLTLVLLGAGAFVATRTWRRWSLKMDGEWRLLTDRAHAVLADLEHTSSVVRRRVDDVDRTMTSLQLTRTSAPTMAQRVVGGVVSGLWFALGRRFAGWRV